MQIRALTTTGLCLGLMWALLATTADGQMPGMQGNVPMVSQASYMIPENMPPGVSQAMYQPSGPVPPGSIAQVGFCSSSNCSSCDGGCAGCGGCGGPGGLIGQVCQSGGGLNGLQHLCLFCRGSGCSICQAPSNAGNMCGWLGMCKPYTEAGLCAQRWYDIQAEVMFLSMSGSSSNQAVTSLGPGTVDAVTNAVNANFIMSTDDVGFDELAPGWRLTGSMMFGAGGNIEAVYFGSNHFSQTASVSDAASTLFSAYSSFGTAPNNGFDDTDRSTTHSLYNKSDIHNGELNYRRRWVGPYCRFQGSWLLGFRYFDVDEVFGFDARGAATDEYFNSVTETRNALVGAQLGGDLWWNVYPGINLGLGWKGAMFGNRAEQNTSIQANSLLVSSIEEVATDSTTAFLSELQARLAYRVSYSWTLTAAYWFIGVDGLALGAGNLNTTQANELFATPAIPRDARINIDDSITLHGFSLGAEYLW